MILENFPFNLGVTEVAWVKDTLAAMTEEEKISQLFCLILYSDDGKVLDELSEFGANGFMLRPMPTEQAINTVKYLNGKAKIPLFFAANLESGGSGLLTEGTTLGSPMAVAGTGDVNFARQLGEICGAEAAAVGVNFSFAPIIDIDYNFRNPITNTRTFGSSPDLVAKMGCAYVKAIQEKGLAASIKHFPGDGRDERDQHLVTTINDMSAEEWDNSYGEAYKQSIQAGALTVMAGHIMLPSYQKELLPASLSSELLHGLLREKLGFNGLIISDSTTMAGFSLAMPRSKAVPTAIASGCDIFLFANNATEDFEFMKKGYADGIISKERLDEAVTRILGLKAKLSLHKNNLGNEDENLNTTAAMQVVGCESHKKVAKECAEQSITLVKQEEGVLPISVSKHKRVLFYSIEPNDGGLYGNRTDTAEKFTSLLKNEGFEVTVWKAADAIEGTLKPVMSTVENYDLIIYLANLATKSNQTVVRIEWAMPMGANIPIYLHDVPTIFISVANPYHLLDVPRIKTYINTYSASDTTLTALLDKLLGKKEFLGKSPIDAFCGRLDTKL